MLIEPLNFKEFDSATSSKESRKSPFSAKKLKENEPPPPPPPPTFTEDELAAAKRDAYQEGFLSGIKEGISQAESEQANITKQLMENIEVFSKSVEPIFAAYKAHINQLQKDMPTIALAIARKVANHAISRDDESIIETISKHCADMVFHQPKITVYVHPKLSDTLYHTLKKLHGYVPNSTHIEVVGSDMPYGNYKIEWQNGNLEHSTSKIWEQVEKSVSNMLAAADNHEEQLELLNENGLQDDKMNG